jgi:AcrR family transcriptional regulator
VDIRALELNMVHTLNMVRLQVVSDDRRERRRDARRQRYLAAASRIIDRDGLSGVTMQAIADELDCAIGTIYTYFPSKAELLAALTRQGIETLRGSYLTAHHLWDAEVAGQDLDADLAALVELLGFAAFFGAASVVFADEFALQRALLSGGALEDDSNRGTVRPQASLEVVLGLLDTPRRLIEAAEEAGALQPGDALERALRWLASLNAVLLVEHLAPLDRHLFRAAHHARALTADLLVGWGADRAEVEVAGAQVERLAALGPMAPPPD